MWRSNISVVLSRRVRHTWVTECVSAGTDELCESLCCQLAFIYSHISALVCVCVCVVNPTTLKLKCLKTAVISTKYQRQHLHENNKCVHVQLFAFSTETISLWILGNICHQSPFTVFHVLLLSQTPLGGPFSRDITIHLISSANSCAQLHQILKWIH